MSVSDPYFAGPSVEEAKTPEKPVEAPKEAETTENPKTNSESVTEAPKDSTGDVPEGSIKDVLKWVGDDVDRAKKALAAEKKGDKRSTLITKLEGVIEG